MALNIIQSQKVLLSLTHQFLTQLSSGGVLTTNAHNKSGRFKGAFRHIGKSFGLGVDLNQVISFMDGEI